MCWRRGWEGRRRRQLLLVSSSVLGSSAPSLMRLPTDTAPATLEGIVSQLPSSPDSDRASSEWTPPPSAPGEQDGADAGWGDPLAMLASSQAGPSTAPRAMKTHPTTFAKARPIPTPSPRPPPAARPPLSAPAPARPTSAPAAPSHSSNPSSTPSQPAKDSPWIFFPLTKVLHEQKAAGFPRPLRSHVGGLLTKSKKGRYALNKSGGFREYAKAAQRKGLVEMGVESLGKEWIALKE
ncbi:hypothetical protein BCR35DRAFT_11614 [Leucosporidium creatinivorum]|uniref:Uncharacterized protein n=1 Tax=Leucosporidium creatinivorum TaxID=106004 RepID=A0A1Y2G8N9_9BASI|nr:hypothetical protein BCR35DRAFT_11614 [Leucosporidium creatinivorum]